jgi:hypothetical protein
MDYENLMKKARQSIKEHDKIDTENGFISPSLNLMICLTTAVAAIQAGIATDDFEPIAEGQAMLEEALELLKMLIPSLDLE